MARKKNIPIHLQLNEKLHNWANIHDVLDDPYVSGLSESITKRKNLEIWATLEPLDYLPHPEGIDGEKRLNYARYVSIVRNILVFAPVALTWEAVSKATTAFAKFVQANNAATVNFLEFWQNGYEVLDHKWTISNIAQIDFLIVAIVILLSVLASTLNERGRFLRTQERAKIETSRTQLAIELKIYLHKKRQVSNVSLNSDLAGTIQSLVNATQSIQSSSEILFKSIKDFPNDAPMKKEFREFIKIFNAFLVKKSK